VIPRQPRDGGAFPASFTQRRLWFIERLQPATAAYNLPGALRLQGPVDLAALQRALDEIVRRQESLRTLFLAEDGLPVQVVVPSVSVPLQVVDLRALPPPERERMARRAAETEARQPFALDQAPLLRVRVLRLAESEHVVLYTLHHIISDGWSMGLLLREITALYEAFRAGMPSPLPELPVQYLDFAMWQRRSLEQGALHADLAYWKERLSGAPPLLDLPTDRPRPAAQSLVGAAHAFAIPMRLAHPLGAVGQSAGATLFITLLAAFQVLLSRHSGQQDVCVGAPIAGRQLLETEGLIGFFANTLVIRGDLSGDPSFRKLLAQVRERVLEAYSHQQLPFDHLVEVVQPQRSLQHSPLFQVMLAFQNTANQLWEGDSKDALGAGTGTSKFDLTLALAEEGGNLRGALEYSTDLFDSSTIARLSSHLLILVEEIGRDSGRCLADLSLLTAGERAQLLAEWNDTVRSYAEPRSLHELVAEQAARTPLATAVVFDDEELSYRSLEERAERVACRLLGLGVGPDSRVGVFLERSSELIVALLGILKAGGAYLPLDPSYPQERLELLISDARVSVVLTAEALASSLPETGGATVVYLDGDAGPEPDAATPALYGPTSLDDLAYVIYTSGSTGNPKGVMISHRALYNRLLWMQETYGLEPCDRVLHKTPFSFDVSVWELFWPLLVGARLVVARPGGHQDRTYLAGLIEREQITTLHFVPSMLQAFLEEPDLAGCRCLKRVICSGEALPPALVGHFFDRFDPAGTEIHNLYGPTEAAIDVTFWPCEPGERRGSVPIGRPIANTQIHLLDAQLQPVPIGVAGELFIAGVNLARGYLDRPSLTAERFLPDPHNGRGARMYRTGDRARRTPDGSIEYLGRLDHQVKIRGVRIELGEIEATLREHPAVRDAAVVVREDEQGQSRLVAYLVPDPKQPPAVAEVRTFLRRKLPEVMVPSFYVSLDALPLSPNGKLERRALPAPATDGTGRESPRPEDLSPVEEVLATIWSEVLGLDRIGVHESFFDLGGHSLLASRVVSRIRDAFRVEIPLRNVFEAPTLGGLAERIESQLRVREQLDSPQLAPVPREGDLPLSFAQRRLWFLHQIDPVDFAYSIPLAVRLLGRLHVSALVRSLEEIAGRHESLRTTFHEQEGEAVQRVHPPQPLNLPLVDLRGLPAERREELLLRLAAEEARRPFAVARSPLWRVILLRAGEEDHAVLLTMHHLISDDWSFGIFLRELQALYRSHVEGQPAGLPELPVQYADYSLWQLRWLQGDLLDRAIAYWRESLSDLPSLELPTDRPPPRVQTFSGRTRGLAFPAGLGDALRAVSRRHGLTLFMALLAAFDALLSRWTGQETLAVGTPVANRGRTEIEGLIGFFVNMLVLRTEVGGDPCVRELFMRVREVALGAYTHQELPFEKLVEELQPERDLGRSPLFQVMFALQEELGRDFELPGLALELIGGGGGGAKFDLTLAVQPAGSRLSASLEYNVDLFDGTTIARLLCSLGTLLAAMAAEPERRLSDLPVMEQSEREQMLVEWNDTVQTYPAQSCLHELFEERVRQTPGAIALVDEEGALTYAELNRRANRWARSLRRLGIGPEHCVGILVDRSARMVVALLAVLKSGGAYVPLDPAYPAERLAFIASDAGIDALLTETLLADLLPGEYFPRLLLDADEPSASREDGDLGRTAEPENLAYVIYTSGSTGRPKGVEISHRSLVNFLESMRRCPGMGEGERLLAVTSLSFDIAGLEIFLPLLARGCVRVVAREKVKDGSVLSEELATFGADLLQATPSTWRLLLESGWRGEPSLRALCGGEALPPDLASQLVERCGALWNVYGPTETTIWSTLQRVDSAMLPGQGTLPIGAPLANTQIYLLDRSGQPVMTGAVGEIYIGGDGVARGYRRRPDLTAERFVPDPFALAPGLRLYRTGDLGRWLPDGTIAFLGRADHQVKLRGFRIEPGEIEAALTRYPAIREAVVIAAPKGGDDRRLIAYLVPESQPGPDAQELRSFLEPRLPDHMIPSAFVSLAALPRTPNGKLDRGALPPPEGVLFASGERYVAPRTPLESELATLWAEVLRVARVGIEDSFFELGGHSLLATRLMFRVREMSRVDLALRTLFEKPTVGGMADLIARARAVQAGDGLWSPQPPIVPDAERRYEPFPLTDVQQAYWIGRSGSFELGNVASHNYLEMDIPGLDVRRFNDSLLRVIERHDMLRAFVLPEGRQQVLREVHPYEMEILDLRACDPVERRARLDDVRRTLSHQVLPTDRWPLFEFRVSLLDDERVRLHFSLDYLLVDAWSTAIIFRELTDFYRDPGLRLPALELSFRDCVLAEQGSESSPAYRRSWEYWSRRLPDLPPAPELPLAQRPDRLESPKFVRRRASLTEDRWRRLKEQAVRRGLTPSGVLLAAYAEVLATWSRRQRFTINLTLFGRPPLHPEILDVVGDFTSLSLLAVDHSPAATFRLRARAIQERLWDDLDHRHVGGVRVLRELARRQQKRAESLMPVVFTSTLVHHGAQPPTPSGALEKALEVELGYSISQTPQVWLDHQVQEERGALTFNWDSVDEIFPPGLLDDMFGAYLQLLDRLVDDDGIWEAPALRLVPAEQLAIRARVNATQATPSEGMLQTLFLRQVPARGDRPAVITLRRTLSYSELDRRSLALAMRLREQGARPNRLVAVVMEKGWEQVVAVLGILRAGAAYLPIEASLPAERRRVLLEQGEAELAVTQPWLAPVLEWPPGVKVLTVDDAEPPAASENDLPSDPRPEDLAYVIFTSGSTGQPKGVMIDHRGALNTVTDVNRRFGVSPADRVLGLSSLSFDLSVYDIFGLLGAGGCLVLPEPGAARDPARWADLIEREQVTLWNSVPALMEMLVEHASSVRRSALAPLRLSLLSGDWIPVGLPDRIRALNPELQVLSLGGATEASIWSILYPIERVDPEWTSVPYGMPMVNQTFHVLDDALADRPVGVPGELFIGGVGLARGYWRDDEKTSARFIRHPCTGERLYRTGDLGRYLADGNIEFLGREDFQVKIQGVRIELGEIETALERHPAVRTGVVIAAGEGRANRRLVAYVVPESAGPPRADVGEHPPAARLGRLLACLQRLRLPGSPLPKYRYPSAGTLYPVQTYVHVRPGCVEGIAAGTYYYHPGDHSLVLLSPEASIDRSHPAEVNQPVFEKPAFSIFLVGQLAAIAPIYGGLARDFCLLEAGYMTQLLMLSAPTDGIGLRPLGQLAFERIRDAFALDKGHVLLHSLEGGAVDDNGATDSSEETAEAAGVGQHRGLPATGELPGEPLLSDDLERLQFKLSEPGLRRDLAKRPNVELAGGELDAARLAAFSARSSHRHFLHEPLPFGRLSGLLACLRRVDLPPRPQPKYGYPSAGDLYPVQTYLYVKPGRVEGLPGGTYSYQSQEQSLVLLAGEPPIGPGVHADVNREVFQESAFSLFLIAQLRAMEPVHGDLARDFCLLEAGCMGQLLMTVAPEHGIGLCPVGSLEFSAIRQFFSLDDGQVLVHSLLGGPLPGELSQVPGALTPAAARSDRLADELRQFLAGQLPEPMIPSAFVVLDTLPLTPNGKVDRSALPQAAGPAVTSRSAFAAPRTELESAIVAIFSEVLGIEAIGINDNFFDLGGNSLHAVRIHAALQGLLGREIRITDVFRHASVNALAKHFGEQEGGGKSFDEARARAARQRESLKRKGQARQGRRLDEQDRDE
jgi:amino acid adenylation domain-containing protein